jgi:beta-glucosidase
MRVAIILGCILLVICTGTANSYAFPSNFSWGASTSAYQIEGAWNVSGKGLNWNDWYYNYIVNVSDSLDGNVADDFYNRFSEDIKMMKQLGFKNFRMSIAWSRILPNGTIDNVNQEGVDFYNQVFSQLVAAGINPWVTLYHSDFPQALSWPNATGSWLNPKIMDIFNDYADFCFSHFGDRVKHWITLNEPAISAWFGYGLGWGLPYRCTPNVTANCEALGGGGNSSTEPYIAAKNLMLSHALAVQTYRNKYQPTQKGMIGWNLNIAYVIPWNTSEPNDVAAVNTYLHFNLGWFANPMVYGDYPEIMKEYVTGDRLVPFTPAESALIQGSYDFFGFDYYTSNYVQYTGIVGNDYGSDSRVVTNTSSIDGTPIGPQAESNWLFAYPAGMRGILNWIKKTYNNPPVAILEDGWDVPGESNMTVHQAIQDIQRIQIISANIDNMVAAITEDGCNVIAYFVWALIDNFEWGSYIPRFGLVYVDYNDNLRRIPKTSAYWYIKKTHNISEWARTGNESYYSLPKEQEIVAYY